MRRLRLSAIARRDLAGVAKASEESWGAAQRVRYMKAIERKLEQICERPELGPPFVSRHSGLHRIRSGRHIIFYQFDDERVFVVRILHDAMALLQRLDEI